MKPNRSVPPATVIPVLVYPDVRAAVEWLCRVFGFSERVQIGEDHRAQLAIGERDAGAVILGDTHGERRPPRQGEETHGVMVRVEDIDAHYERTRSAGAQIVSEPQDHMSLGRAAALRVSDRLAVLQPAP